MSEQLANPAESKEQYVGAIYEDIKSVKFMVFSSKTLKVIASHEINVATYCDAVGWSDQNPMEIVDRVKETIDVTCQKLMIMNISPFSIVSIGITTQPDTAVMWDCVTGLPLFNALTSVDFRSKRLFEMRMNNIAPYFDSVNEKLKFFQNKCGLVANPCLSVFKLLWLFENVLDVRKALENGRCMFGTLDSWIIWNLTGGNNGGIHIIDVTNASRIMLMNISSLKWDISMFEFLQMPNRICMPTIKSCSEMYGFLDGGALKGTPISGSIVMHQASNVGQLCFVAGQAKSTIDIGCYMSYNTGRKAVISKNNLLTTVAYKMGQNADTVYSLEGNVALAQNVTESLMQKLFVAKTYDGIPNTENVAHGLNKVRVPTFSGVYMPSLKKVLKKNDKTGLLDIKPMLQVICSQMKNVLQLMALDTGHPVLSLNVDGELSNFDTVLQSLTNICDVPVVRADVAETAAFGAAIAAGLALDVWRMHSLNINSETFVPATSVSGRIPNKNIVKHISFNTDKPEEEQEEEKEEEEDNFDWF